MPRPKGSRVRGVPLELKLQRGSYNPSKDKARGVRVPRLRPHVPPPPKHFDAFHREVYVHFANDLSEMRVCTKQDWASLEVLTCTYCEMRKLRAEIMELPSLTYEVVKEVEKKGGALVRYHTLAIRPEVSALNAVDTRLTGLLGRFGLTPADRGRVDDLGAKDEDGAPKAPEEEFGSGAA